MVTIQGISRRSNNETEYDAEEENEDALNKAERIDYVVTRYLSNEER